MRFFILFILLPLTNASFAEDEAVFLENYILNPENVTLEDKERLSEITDIDQKLRLLPWSAPSQTYKLVKTASILFQMHQVTAEMGALAVGQVETLASGASQLASGLPATELITEGISGIAESTVQFWSGISLLQEAHELFNSPPGQKIEMLGADYEPFMRLFEQLEILKALDKYKVNDLQLYQKVINSSVLSLLQVSRQLAGIKMITGGEIITFSLEAEIASTLLELPQALRKSLLESWEQSYPRVVNSQTFPLSKGRRTLKKEVAQFLEDLHLMIDNEDLNKGIRTSTYTAKTGILLLSLLQVKFRSADDALSMIAETNETLEKYGLSNAVTRTALTPLSFSASMIQKGVSNGTRWSIGSVAYLEHITGKGIQELSQIRIGLPTLKLPDVPKFPDMPSFPRIDLPEAPSMPRWSLPEAPTFSQWNIWQKNVNCKSLLK